MAKGTSRLGVGVLLGLLYVLWSAWYPVAGGLYAVGLWPRLTPEEVALKLKADYRVTVTHCAHGTNGWEYICQLPTRPGKRQFFDKLGVYGSPRGIGHWVELRPGPIPSREAHEEESHSSGGR
jgi:hypothetical protein